MIKNKIIIKQKYIVKVNHLIYYILKKFQHYFRQKIYLYLFSFYSQEFLFYYLNFHDIHYNFSDY